MQETTQDKTQIAIVAAITVKKFSILNHVDNLGSISVSGQLPTYASPNSTTVN